MLKKQKVSLIGGGNIGGTLAHILAQKKNFLEVVILDKNPGFAEGKSLDMSTCSPLEGFNATIRGTNDYKEIADSDVIIVTAGSPRKPGMTRNDLLKINAEVIKEIALNIKQYSPDSFVIVITNPLDAMIHVMHDISGLPSHKLAGMAGVLDSARLRYFLSQALGVPSEDVQSFVLGGHGDSMVPLIRYANVSGIPIDTFVQAGMITEQQIEAIKDRTRKGGAEIVNLMKKSSAFYSPAASAIAMAESYLFNQNKILPCAAYLKGEYGVNNLFVGVPAMINANGVNKVIEIQLDKAEKESFLDSVKSVESIVKETRSLL